ncbi:hypothetical protein GYMLUDRAFT_33787 [Collybiopsis luxurians FD-317 M1]|nr:hypothetical protein GYMLUDRAFT_33787 [Collybiopsis luxurians FD-317 M1]
MASLPRVPHEICDLIIDESSDSSNALKNLSLVHKSWLPRARQHLFRRLRLSEVCFKAGEFFEEGEILELPKRFAAMKECYSQFIPNAGIARFIKGFVLQADVFGVGPKFGSGIRCAAAARASLTAAHPCDLLGLEDMKHCEFLVFVENEVDPSNYHLTTDCFPFVFRSVGSAKIRCLDFQGGLFQVTQFNGFWWSSPGLNVFKHLRNCTPSLQTLCFRDLVLGVGSAINSTADVEAVLRQHIEPLTNANEAIASKRAIALRNFCYLNVDSHLIDIPLHNAILKILLFENMFISFRNLVNLALRSSSIPLFSHYSTCFCNVRSLTIFDSSADNLPDMWAYNKGRICLPALTRLQLVLSRRKSLLTLCRLILGPSTAGPIETCRRIEYPGPHSYFNLDGQRANSGSEFSRPQVEHLHIEFLLSKSKLNSELAQEENVAERIDAMLYSYLDIDDSACGPLKWITVNMLESELRESWPRTGDTGRLYQGRCDNWWDSQWW